MNLPGRVVPPGIPERERLPPELCPLAAVLGNTASVLRFCALRLGSRFVYLAQKKREFMSSIVTQASGRGKSTRRRCFQMARC